MGYLASGIQTVISPLPLFPHNKGIRRISTVFSAWTTDDKARLPGLRRCQTRFPSRATIELLPSIVVLRVSFMSAGIKMLSIFSPFAMSILQAVNQRATFHYYLITDFFCQRMSFEQTNRHIHDQFYHISFLPCTVPLPHRYLPWHSWIPVDRSLSTQLSRTIPEYGRRGRKHLLYGHFVQRYTYIAFPR